MTEGVGVVELKKMKLNLPDGGLKLAYGGVLKEIEVAYEECGAPLGDSNAIYICHALTGDARVAGIRPGEEKPSRWWEEMVGPGRAFDTNRFHIICANVLGGCTGTTGPMSINPDTGKPYGSSFPQYTFDDAVDVFRMFLKQLGVKKLAALVGGSYGGLQVVNWMTRFPDDMEKSCLIATSASLNTQAIALSVMSRNSITDDPNWKGGDYYLEGDGKGPKAGLAAARQLAHITYLSRELLQQKFGRRLQDNFVNAPAEERAERDRLFKTYFQIESYLDYQAMKFLRRFDANSYLHITRSMDLSDPCDRYGTLDAALAQKAHEDGVADGAVGLAEDVDGARPAPVLLEPSADGARERIRVAVDPEDLLGVGCLDVSHAVLVCTALVTHVCIPAVGPVTGIVVPALVHEILGDVEEFFTLRVKNTVITLFGRKMLFDLFDFFQNKQLLSSLL